MVAQRARRRRAHIFAKEKHGHYVEPLWCSARLFDVEFFGPRGSIILDPACGWGRCLQSARDAGFRVMGADIVHRVKIGPGTQLGPIWYRMHDFLTGPIPTRAKITSIVCNPPFDHVEEFCRQACKVAYYKVAMLCLLRRLPAAHWLTELPLEKIYLLTPRPSMPPGRLIEAGNKPGGGSQDFVWLVFNNIRTTWASDAVSIRWLHRDRGQDNGLDAEKSFHQAMAESQKARAE